jgi:hypothetical protein
MGVYATRSLPIYAYLHQDSHPHDTIVDSFFQTALRGSRAMHRPPGSSMWMLLALSALPQPCPEPADLRALTSAANPSLRRSESAFRAASGCL